MVRPVVYSVLLPDMPRHVAITDNTQQVLSDYFFFKNAVQTSLVLIAC